MGRSPPPTKRNPTRWACGAHTRNSAISPCSVVPYMTFRVADFTGVLMRAAVNAPASGPNSFAWINAEAHRSQLALAVEHFRGVGPFQGSARIGGFLSPFFGIHHVPIRGAEFVFPPQPGVAAVNSTMLPCPSFWRRPRLGG